MASHQWFDSKLSELKNDETRGKALLEMKEHLKTLSPEDMDCSNLPLLSLYECFSNLQPTANDEQVNLACDVLTMCMTNLSLSNTVTKYGSMIEEALSCSSSGVKKVALKELKRRIEEEEVLLYVCKSETLLDSIVSCLGDEDIAVAHEASKIIEIVAEFDQGMSQLVNGTIVQRLHQVMELNEIARFRVYEVLIAIASQSEPNFNLLKTTDFFSSMLGELDNNDPLLKVNILELLSQLGSTQCGFNYLEENKAISKVLSLLNSHDDITLQLCEPGILKFYGKIAYHKPIELVSTYPQFIKRLFENCESNDFTLLAVSLDTLGYIGMTNNGKIALHSQGEAIENIIQHIGRNLLSHPNELKVRCLNCIENLLRVTEPNNQVWNITHRWYNLLGDNPMDLILNYAKNPFPDLRLSGLGILNALSNQYWGQEIINDTPGLIEFLLDRNTETAKEAKETKYCIVQALAEGQIFGEHMKRKLLKYLKEGPFYVHMETEVALESAE